MILKWPDKNWNKKYDNLIYQSDIAATIVRGLKKKVPNSWDGLSFFDKIENSEEFGRNYLIISQMAWSCQRTVIFDNWTMIRTYHTGLKDFPEYMLFDRENDFYMLNNLAREKPDIVANSTRYLEEWETNMMRKSTSQIDPLWTVWQEGGPSHCRGMLNRYLEHLKGTDRGHLIDKILERNEAYE